MFYFGAGERAQQLTMYGALTEYPSLILSTQVGWLTTACNPRSRKIRHLWSLFETIVTCTLFPCSCNWDKNIKKRVFIFEMSLQNTSFPCGIFMFIFIFPPCSLSPCFLFLNGTYISSLLFLLPICASSSSPMP